MPLLAQERRFEMPRHASDAENRERPEIRQIRNEVRRRLNFYRHVFTYVVVVGILAIIDWLTGGDWWVAWVAGIWGAFLILDFLRDFVGPLLWGRNVEDRLVEREVKKRGLPPQEPPAQ
jgi:hypothetical protein